MNMRVSIIDMQGKPHHDDQGSLWHATAVPAEGATPLGGDAVADVVVIGAGFTGLRAAHRLAEAGRSAVVLDARTVGHGASGRNGGQVNPILPFNSPDAVRRHVGKTHFHRLAETSLGAADALFGFIRDHQIQCDARQHGWLRVDHAAKAESVSRANAESWKALGADIRPVAGDELRSLTGSPAYRTGWLAAKGGAVHPLSLARGLAKVARGAGVRIHEDTPVTALEPGPNGWRVVTPGGTVRAERVVLATNGYSGPIRRDVQRSVLPLVSIQIGTGPLDPERVADILPGGQTISDTRRVIMYARREPGSRVVFGGHGRMRRDGTFAGFDALIRDAVRVFPQLEEVDWPHRWGGRIALTADHLPHLHEPAPGLSAGLGYNGRGVAMANVMGTVLADHAMGKGDLPFPVTPPKAFPMRELHRLGEMPAVALMKFLDAREIA